MKKENLITEDDTTKQDVSEEKNQVKTNSSLVSIDRKKKKHNSALLAVAKARSEAIHKAGNSSADGLHPIGTNITYKNGDGIL